MLTTWPNMFMARAFPRRSRSACPHAAALTSSSHPQRLVQPVHPPGELRIGERVDDPAVLHDEKSIGQGRREAEILLDEQDRETRSFELGDGAADLLNDDRRETLRRLVEHQEARAGAQDSRDREHLLLAAGQLAAAACKTLP